ncbi:hypothetical protein [Massilia suwonensis]|uniref:Uncharacterized protein n=1 Tax=Massilia suwonensis TaxID=648895 RepID=A0ABW0MRR2_9BURK
MDRTKRMITARVLEQYRACPEAFADDVTDEVPSPVRKQVSEVRKKEVRFPKKANLPAKKLLDRQRVDTQAVLNAIRGKVKQQSKAQPEPPIAARKYTGWNQS